MNPTDLAAIHALSSRHSDAVQRSALCGCFYCLRTFPATQIAEWVDGIDGARPVTALCPHCGIDSVLPDASVTLTGELLEQMHRVYFT